jgi:hypothetical protein
MKVKELKKKLDSFPDDWYVLMEQEHDIDGRPGEMECAALRKSENFDECVLLASWKRETDI